MYAFMLHVICSFKKKVALTGEVQTPGVNPVT